MEKNFTHIHCHTHYSLLDGMGSPLERVLRAKELNMKALAITDHNHLGGVLEFQSACKENGIKPLLGVELYWTWDRDMISLPLDKRTKIAQEEAIKNGIEIPRKATKKEINELIKPYMYDTKGYHIILIAKNQIGWHNLVKIQSEASEKGLFNARFHCDNELLKKYSEGIICTTACIGSVIANSIKHGKIDTAEKILTEWKEIFGKENLFVEIQGLDWEVQKEVNIELIKLAKKLDLKIIATNDVHYTRQSDIDDHDTLLCIGLGKKKDEIDRMRYEPEFWMRSYDEMVNAFKRLAPNEEYMEEVIKGLENTNLIAEMVDGDIRLKSEKPLFTEVKLPKGYTSEKYLTYKCWKKLYKYLAKHPEYDRREYEARLNWELYVINKKGYAPYMLTVDEFIFWSNSNKIPTGPGRGSAAGSLVLFLLGITKVIDPIQNGLLFSRFLTMDRTALPDVDVDFCYYGRDRVIEHMEEVYGEECVAHIGTYSELGVKSGVRDIGRVLDMPYAITDEISKKITVITDEAPSISFKDLDEYEKTDPEKYRQFKEIENEYPELFRLARRFEGTKRNFGVHASGILTTPNPITDTFPIRIDPDTGVKVTLYTGPQVEECNGVKYDFLGLKTVSVIDKAMHSIDETLEWEDLYKTVELDDEGVFDMICNKETEAVFQIESDLFKGIISDMQPTSMDDIVVLTSIGRPGPLQAGMHTKYNNRKNGLEEVVMPVHDTEDIVGDTFGTIVYQEQVMAIAKKIAGFDDNQADSYLRKALAKKKQAIMDLCKRWLIYGKKNEEAPKGYDNNNPNCTMYDPSAKYGAPILGASNNGYDIKDLEAFWADMEGYASYLFNKSHAACYSYITLLTAYLKRYYPVDFFASVLSVQDDEKKRVKYIPVVEDMGLQVELPDINISNKDFTPLPENFKILYGLGSIKGVGENAVKEILKIRKESGEFTSLQDMMDRIPKKFLNKRVGEALIKSGALDKFNTNRNALLNEFYTLRKDKIEIMPTADTYDEKVCMDYETKTLGLPITYKPWWDEVETNQTIEIEATVVSNRELIDKNGNMMSFPKIESEGVTIPCVAFARTYCANSNKFEVREDRPQPTLIIKGKKDSRKQLIISSVKFK